MTGMGGYGSGYSDTSVTSERREDEKQKNNNTGTAGGTVSHSITSKYFVAEGRKSVSYLNKRGWSVSMIESAIESGPVGTSINKVNNNACSVYRYPGTDYYVVIEDCSGKLIQLSEFGNNSWVPDGSIEFFGR